MVCQHCGLSFSDNLTACPSCHTPNSGRNPWATAFPVEDTGAQLPSSNPWVEYFGSEEGGAVRSERRDSADRPVYPRPTSAFSTWNEPEVRPSWSQAMSPHAPSPDLHPTAPAPVPAVPPQSAGPAVLSQSQQSPVSPVLSQSPVPSAFPQSVPSVPPQSAGSSAFPRSVPPVLSQSAPLRPSALQEDGDEPGRTAPVTDTWGSVFGPVNSGVSEIDAILMKLRGAPAETGTIEPQALASAAVSQPIQNAETDSWVSTGDPASGRMTAEPVSPEFANHSLGTLPIANSPFPVSGADCAPDSVLIPDPDCAPNSVPGLPSTPVPDLELAPIPNLAPISVPDSPVNPYCASDRAPISVSDRTSAPASDWEPSPVPDLESIPIPDRPPVSGAAPILIPDVVPAPVPDFSPDPVPEPTSVQPVQRWNPEPAAEFVQEPEFSPLPEIQLVVPVIPETPLPADEGESETASAWSSEKTPIPDSIFRTPDPGPIAVNPVSTDIAINSASTDEDSAISDDSGVIIADRTPPDLNRHSATWDRKTLTIVISLAVIMAGIVAIALFIILL